MRPRSVRGLRLLRDAYPNISNMTTHNLELQVWFRREVCLLNEQQVRWLSQREMVSLWKDDFNVPILCRNRGQRTYEWSTQITQKQSGLIESYKSLRVSFGNAQFKYMTLYPD